MAFRRTTRRKLQLESLEARLLLDGNVVSKLSNGVLTLTGDVKDNAIAISTAVNPTTPTLLDLVVTGQSTPTLSGQTPAKPTKINGKLEAATFNMADVQSIKIDMKDGRNVVTVGVILASPGAGVEAGGADHSMTIPKDLTINTGKTADEISLNGILVNGNLSISSGAGSDSVDIGYGTDVMLKTNINAGEGNNSVYVGGYLHGGLAVTTGAGYDYVTIYETLEGGATINTGAGRDTVYVDTSAELGAPVTLTGNLTINGGAGRNYITTGASVAGNVSVVTTTGDDYIEIGSAYDYDSWSDIPSTITGSVTVTAGDGNNHVELSANVKGNASLLTGKNDDYVYVEGLYDNENDEDISIKVTGDVKIDTGAGEDDVNMYSVDVSADTTGKGGNVSISTGAGGELATSYSYPFGTLPLEASENVYVGAISVAKDLLVNLGDGDGELFLGSSKAANAKIVSGRGSTLMGITALDLGAGTLSIQNGLGDNSLMIGTAIPEAESQPFGLIAGTVNIATSSDNMCEVLLDNMTLSKTLSLAIAGNGDSYISMNGLIALEATNFDSLSIATGNGADTISVLNVNANSVSIKTLAGNDTVAVDSVMSNLVKVDLGDGDDAVSLGAAITPTNVLKVNLDGGKGTDRRDIAFADPPAAWLTHVNFELPTA